MLARQEIDHLVSPQPLETQSLGQFTAANGYGHVQTQLRVLLEQLFEIRSR